MDPVAASSCVICGERMAWRSFAVTQSALEDRVRVYPWEDVISAEQVYPACCSAHVRELVIHWMVTGSMDYPFAKASSTQTQENETRTRPAEGGGVANFAVAIGELAIDRDSVSRLLNKNPAWLEVILDELHDALEQSIEARASVAPADQQEIHIHHS